MKQVTSFIIMLLLAMQALAHGGEDHGSAAKAAPSAVNYFSSEARSDKYEVLVKWTGLEAGKEATLLLFLSDAHTNRAADAALMVKLAEAPGAKFLVARTDTGTYQVTGVFPEKKKYSLQVNINGNAGPDLLQLQDLEPGRKLPAVADTEGHRSQEQPWIYGLAGLVAGVGIMFFVMRRRAGRIAFVILTASLLIPTAAFNPGYAHGGEDHGATGKKGGSLSAAFVVEKEAQFLFHIGTQPAGSGSFLHSSELPGTVIAAPQGRAVIQAPQTGKITVLRVQPGQAVRKGEVLAIVEQQVEAGTQLTIISQRNALEAELKAARAQYERLQAIADIAAKKDLTEARARYESAQHNLALFRRNIGGQAGSTRMITLAAPIDGVVGTFNYAIGAVVSAGETLFEITNLDKLYIETQLFANDDAPRISKDRFVAFAANDTTAVALQLVSAAQTVSSGNQAQRVLFEAVRPGGRFRIGENLRVLRQGGDRTTQLVIPTAAIVDVNGKPAVFIKDRAERFSISFVQKGESNPRTTIISKGVEAGEHIVTENVYQMKMIYLGQ